MQPVWRKLESDAEDWWNDIEYFIMLRGKTKIYSLPRMRKVMVNFFITCDFDEILLHTSQIIWELIHTVWIITRIMAFSEEPGLEFNNVQPILKEILKMLNVMNKLRLKAKIMFWKKFLKRLKRKIRVDWGEWWNLGMEIAESSLEDLLKSIMMLSF